VSRRLRTALIGAGLVGQAEHAFYLWEERERFAFDAVVDASPTVRAAVAERYAIEHALASVDDLAGRGFDAVVCATPDPIHPQVVTRALELGLHVLCEKPLALTTDLCDAIVAARDRAGKVVQVAYMKRFDPSTRRLLELLPADPADVRLISVECNDPDEAPFVDHLPLVVGRDVPAEVIAEGRRLGAEHLAQSAGGVPAPHVARALGGGFLSSLVHDMAVIAAILDRYDEQVPETALSGAIFDDGRGVALAFALPGGGRCAMTHLNLPGVADYTERITVYCTDRILELVFPSPYLRHLPTTLTARRTAGEIGLETTTYRASYEEAFRNELRAFHAAVVEGVPVETPPEKARRDVALLVDACRRAAA
jgi:predicted dehydrogenase